MSAARFVKVLWFLSVFSGAFGFSFSILVSRVLYDNSGLHGLLSLQVNTAFIAFLIQFGLRAGLRKEYLVGNYRVVGLIENILLRRWPVFVMPVSFFCLFFFSGSVLPAIYSINAMLTLLVGLRLVQHRVSSAGGYSLLIFVVNFLSGLVFVFFDKYSAGFKGVLVESISMFVGVLIAVIGFSGGRSHHSGLGVIKAIVFKYAGLQASSFIIILSSYIYAQTILYLSINDAGLVVVFSDAVLVSGGVSMVLSRVLLLFEKNVVRGEKVSSYILLSHFLIFLFCLFYSVIYSFIGEGGVIMPFLIVIFLMGKITIAQVSSFINEKRRRSFSVALLVLIFMQLIIYSDRYFGYRIAELELYASLCNMFFLSIVLVLFYAGKNDSYIKSKRVFE